MKKILLFTVITVFFICNFTVLGAQGDNTAAIIDALASGDVLLPAGDYYISALTVPANTTLGGESGTVIHANGQSTDSFITLLQGAALENVELINDSGTDINKAVYINRSAGATVSGTKISGFKYALYNYYSSGMTCTDCSFNCSSGGIYTDHANNMRCINTEIINTKTGIETVFSSNVTVSGCYIKNCSNHGIQYWNNYNGNRDGGTLLYENNTVLDIGHGGIWGSGGTGVIMRGNVVDNCGDVGLDMEYTKTGEISQNTVMRCANGAVACFCTCDGIDIYENRIFNNRPVYGYNDYISGVWLTKENSKYAYDTGNVNIDIFNNTIYVANDSGSHLRTREAIRIESSNRSAHNIGVSGNVIIGIPYRVCYNLPEGEFTRDGQIQRLTGDGGKNTVQNSYSALIRDYRPVQSSEAGEYISAGDSSGVLYETSAVGAYRADYTVSKTSTAAGQIVVTATDNNNGTVIKQRTFALPVGALNGYCCSLFFDAECGSAVALTVENTGNAGITLDETDVSVIEFQPVVLISSENGVEYINNSDCRLKTSLYLNRAGAGKYGGFIKCERTTDNTSRLFFASKLY